MNKSEEAPKGASKKAMVLEYGMDSPANEVVDALFQRGIEVSVAYVNNCRSQYRKETGQVSTRGRKPSATAGGSEAAMPADPAATARRNARPRRKRGEADATNGESSRAVAPSRAAQLEPVTPNGLRQEFRSLALRIGLDGASEELEAIKQMART